MKNVRVYPFQGRNTIEVPSSKSELHRLLIAAALSDRETRIGCRAVSEDVRATVRCLQAMGSRITEFQDALVVAPIGADTSAFLPVLDCGESGSTLRFLLPVAAALGGARFEGRGRLPQRPISELKAEMEAHGVRFSEVALPFSVSGRLTGGAFTLPGHVSSQYVTGLMLASPLLGGTEIRIEGRLQSVDYVRMTADVMRRFGVQVEYSGSVIRVPGGQGYLTPGTVRAGSDWSGAAFPLCLGALGGPVKVQGLTRESLQGDRRIVDLLAQAGADVKWAADGCAARRGGLRGIEVDVSDIPDLAPVLAALLMHAEGRSALLNAERLRLKESDRLATTRDMVNALGGQAEIEGNSLIIQGRPDCRGGEVDGAGDHRIVMASAVGASACSGPSVITGADAVAKSWPSFFEDMIQLGGRFDVVDAG